MADPWRFWLADIIAKATGCPGANVAAHWPTIFAALDAAGIADRPTQEAAIATVAVETGDFTPREEIESAYWDTYSGGRRFHGRGYIQLTGDFNYRQYGAALGVDLLGNPDLALDPTVAAKVLARYFLDRDIPGSARAGDWPAVRRKVQGGSAGLDRLTAIVRGLEKDSMDLSRYVFPLPGWSGPIDPHWGSHVGAADLFAPRGTPVVAMIGGTVELAGTGDVGGNYVMWAGDDGLEYYACHGDQPPSVKAGQRIETGAYLMPVGDSGNAAGKGTMLHIGIGKRIIAGAGPAGGAGEDFDAVALLRSVLTAAPPGTHRVAGTGGSGLNLRESPSTTAKVLASIPDGAAVVGRDRAWRPVEWQGTAGWVAEEFLEEV